MAWQRRSVGRSVGRSVSFDRTKHATSQMQLLANRKEGRSEKEGLVRHVLQIGGLQMASKIIKGKFTPAHDSSASTVEQ